MVARHFGDNDRHVQEGPSSHAVRGAATPGASTRRSEDAAEPSFAGARAGGSLAPFCTTLTRRSPTRTRRSAQGPWGVVGGAATREPAATGQPSMALTARLEDVLCAAHTGFGAGPGAI